MSRRMSALDTKVQAMQKQIDYLYQLLPDDDETKLPDEQEEKRDKASRLFSEGVENILGFEVGVKKNG